MVGRAVVADALIDHGLPATVHPPVNMHVDDRRQDTAPRRAVCGGGGRR